MRRIALGITVGAFMLLIPASATTKPTPTTTKSAGKSVKSTRTAWRAETLTGKILSVDPARKLVIVEDASGVTFDMRVTGSTRIQAGKQILKLEGLKADMGIPIKVKFKPERTGDIAQSIQVGG